jgi:choline-sulfatase
MVRTDQYKLILYPEAKRVQLFDLKEDPWETKNLAGDFARSATVPELSRRLKKWQQTVHDSLVLDPASLGIQP